jgi:hypothetical protein
MGYPTLFLWTIQCIEIVERFRAVLRMPVGWHQPPLFFVPCYGCAADCAEFHSGCHGESATQIAGTWGYSIENFR